MDEVSGAGPSIREALYVADMASEAPIRSYGKVFDQVAADYDRFRPAYPDDLVDHACQLAELESGDRVLEVGCGSGQLTQSLLARGLEVTAVEPGKDLLALAKKNAEGRDEARFVNASFEDAQLAGAHFRALFSASAFHWVDPTVGWRKAADLLAPDGTLALIQHVGLKAHDDQEALLSALARVAPEIAAGLPSYRDLDTTRAGAEQRREDVSEAWAWLVGSDVAWSGAGRLFEDVQIASVPVVFEHTADQLNSHLGTTSLFARLSTGQRQALERENLSLYNRLGRPIRSSTAAVLVTARRRTTL